MSIGLQMVTPVNVTTRKILHAMHAEIIKRLHTGAIQTTIKRETKKILNSSLRAQPEFQELTWEDSRLRAELGVKDSASAAEKLVRDWVRSTSVRISIPYIVGNQIVGPVITIQAIEADYQDVLSKAYASYTTKMGEIIPWLEWLLTRGVEILVLNHAVFHPLIPTAASRTGTNTIMKKTDGGGWGVPTEWAGLPDDNWATRAVADAMPDIRTLLEHETIRRL